MIHLDLCSGIGGFALAASWVWPEHRVASFVEIEPYCQQILRKHWPEAPIHDDLKTFDARPLLGSIDLLTGGYPCQPFSVAGERKGAQDDRHLWPEVLRVVVECRPRWALFENVAGHVTMGLDDVLADLEGIGYTAEAAVIPACAVDAPHRRDRVWIIAADTRHRNESERSRPARREGGEWAAERGVIGCLGEVGALGPMAHPNRHRRQPAHAGEGGGVRDGERDRSPSERGRQQLKPRTVAHGEVLAHPEGEGLPQRPWRCGDGAGLARPQRDGSHGRGGAAFWSPEPDVCRVADGVPRRVDRLRALGNAIVPQVAAEIMRAIRLADEQP